MTFKDRINELISWLKISRAEFERRAKLSNGYTRNLGGVPGAEKLENILRAFPEVSRSWLLTGEGEMLKNSTELEENTVAAPADPVAPADDMASRILELAENFRADLAAKDRIIADLVENNSRLTRLVEEYKKAPAAAPGIPAPAVAD